MSTRASFSTHFSLERNTALPFLDSLATRLPTVRNREELKSILKNSSDDLLQTDLFLFARRLDAENKPELSLEIYRWLNEAPAVAENIKSAARESMAALLGTADFGANTEALIRRVAHESTDARWIAPMLGATVIGRLGKLGALGQMFQRPWAS